MNFSKYRDTNDYREILRLFQKSSEQQNNLLWQNINGKREVYAISNLEIDFVGREVVGFLENPSDLKPGHTAYFKLSYNDTIFKLSDFFVQQDCVSFKFPETLKTWDLRANERFSLDDGEEYSAVLSADSASDVSQQMKVRLKDFSATGLGLTISELNKHIIKQNKTFWIHAINDYKFHRPIVADVMYLSKEIQDKRYRFGVQLQQSLPIEAVKSILG
ncbi:MAG: hypothetical protein WDA09_01765 [Bacteriovoracaceae bacterium]